MPRTRFLPRTDRSRHLLRANAGLAGHARLTIARVAASIAVLPHLVHLDLWS